jgi:hypothetical protein
MLNEQFQIVLPLTSSRSVSVGVQIACETIIDFVPRGLADEKSSFYNEVGAAIHLAPNATRVLKSWHCDLNAMEPSRCEGVDIWSSQGDFIVSAAVSVCVGPAAWNPGSVG